MAGRSRLEDLMRPQLRLDSSELTGLITGRAFGHLRGEPGVHSVEAETES